ncbi:UDP-glucose dehydrogenase family protein [Nafulsella turpanensis]|uniref:UDP-glucose dehydrogenase family protein n=1 Tax=Nafulsella turpanensis TaxID=1265690 RepID=UPI000348F43F|nr:UDP-glucose/GDP-mannose dehydrogenase family protein [Nafulsella turpanensis]
MNLAVFGTGYVGLVSGVCLANTGKKVFCIDINEDKLQKIKNGIAPIYEPGLEDLLKKNKDRIVPTTDARSAIQQAEVVMIAVGTPFDGQHIDLSYIKQAAKEIGQAVKEMDSYVVVTVKSTVVPGTTMDVVRPIVLEESGKSEDEIGFCMNPEFLREGNAVEDFKEPDRIVLGVSSERAEEVMRRLYDGFPETDVMVTNPTTAEMVKYTANTLLALNISYANEIARICETLEDVDSEDVFAGVIKDKRVSPIINGERITPKLTTYLRAGCGFGGSCFPKDVKALASFARDRKVDGKLLDGLLHINKSQMEHIFELGLKKHGGEAKKVAILGTAFKPDTDDIRESPGIRLAEFALERGMEVHVHDYKALENTKAEYGEKLKYHEEPLAAVEGADIVYVATIWDDYLQIADEAYEARMADGGVMVDCRSLYKNRAEQPWRVRVGVGKKKQNQNSEVYAD